VAGEGVDVADPAEAVGAGAPEALGAGVPEHADRITAMAADATRPWQAVF
jgi:arginase family enzyme